MLCVLCVLMLCVLCVLMLRLHSRLRVNVLGPLHLTAPLFSGPACERSVGCVASVLLGACVRVALGGVECVCSRAVCISVFLERTCGVPFRRESRHKSFIQGLTSPNPGLTRLSCVFTPNLRRASRRSTNSNQPAAPPQADDGGPASPAAKRARVPSAPHNTPSTPLHTRLDSPPGTAYRALTLQLPHGEVRTPVYMPVGTRGTVKGVPPAELEEDGGLSSNLILGNTYHLANRPTAQRLDRLGGLHAFAGWRGNLLTDSGGFQMVSLLNLSQVTEEGVEFENPREPTSRLLLTPEESVRTQHSVGSDILMALDDVVSSVHPDRARFEEATARTVRWLDRCLAAHEPRAHKQNLFAIVQGRAGRAAGRPPRPVPGRVPGARARAAHPGLRHWRAGRRREQGRLLARRGPLRQAPARRQAALRHGHRLPVDLLVCTALGADMYDCVFPTRVARFGTALVRRGQLKLKGGEFARDQAALEDGCGCRVCGGASGHYTSRAALHHLFRTRQQLAAVLLTHHNLAFLHRSWARCGPPF